MPLLPAGSVQITQNCSLVCVLGRSRSMPMGRGQEFTVLVFKTRRSHISSPRLRKPRKLVRHWGNSQFIAGGNKTDDMAQAKPVAHTLHGAVPLLGVSSASLHSYEMGQRKECQHQPMHMSPPRASRLPSSRCPHNS